MSNEELKETLDSLSRKIDKRSDVRQDWFKIMVGTFGVLIITIIFSAGIIYRDFQELKDCAIPQSEWTDVKNKANLTYNKVFNIPEFTTRGK